MLMQMISKLEINVDFYFYEKLEFYTQRHFCIIIECQQSSSTYHNVVTDKGFDNQNVVVLKVDIRGKKLIVLSVQSVLLSNVNCQFN